MSFEFDAEKYRKASTHQKEWGQKLISELDLTADKKILDLGCGDGSLTAELAELVSAGFVVGIDASQNMIDLAKKTYSLPNLRFDLKDINEINYENEFDVVLSNATLHWIKNHAGLLSNIYKALKPDGILRFNFAADGNCSTFFKVVRQVMKERPYSVYFERFEWPWYMPTIEAYKTLLAASDFRESSVWGENADRYFPDKAAMIKWIDQPSLVPFLEYIDGPDKKSFRDAVVERMVEETIQDDGKCFETFRRINIFAKK